MINYRKGSTKKTVRMVFDDETNELIEELCMTYNMSVDEVVRMVIRTFASRNRKEGKK